MKRIFLILLTAVLLLPVALSAKTPTVNDLFKEFSSAPNAEFVTISSFPVELDSLNVQGYGKLGVDMIESVKVLDLEKCPQMVKKRFANRVSNINLKDMENIVNTTIDEGADVKIFVRIKMEKIRKFLAICYSNRKCLVVELNGVFDNDR